MARRRGKILCLMGAALLATGLGLLALQWRAGARGPVGAELRAEARAEARAVDAGKAPHLPTSAVAPAASPALAGEMAGATGAAACAATEEEARGGGPTFDVPRLDGIALDGQDGDWGERGFRVDVLAHTADHLRRREDFDANFRLGWDARGLLVLLHVRDSLDVESGDPASGGDSVELFLSDVPPGGDGTAAGSPAAVLPAMTSLAAPPSAPAAPAGSGPSVGPNLIRVAISPGCNPEHQALRAHVIDRRVDPRLTRIPATATAARTRVAGGYVMEVLLPWEGLGVRPEVGREVGFQLQVNDADDSGGASRLLWYPAPWTPRERGRMYRVRLAEAPSPAVRAAAFGGYVRLHRARITVLAEGDLAGKPVEVCQIEQPVNGALASGATANGATANGATANGATANGATANGATANGATANGATANGATANGASAAGPSANGTRVLNAARLHPDFVQEGRASACLTLPMPPRGRPYGTLTVRLDGQFLADLAFPDVGDMGQWVVPYAEVVFKPCVFSGRSFPEADFDDPTLVEDAIGPYEIKTTFYDSAYERVETAEKPGRYGAVVEVRTEDGRVYKRYRTLFREPRDVSWRNADMAMTVTLPKEMGISPAVLKAQSKTVSEYFKQLMGAEGLNHEPATAVLLAGLYEARAGQALGRNEPLEHDQQWWAGLKRKLGEPLPAHLVQLPAGYEKEPGRKWPLVLYLHGKGERGEDLEQVRWVGLPAHREYHPDLPFIVVAPQCPWDGWWSPWELNALLDEVLAHYRVDPDRVYLTGNSMGGYGAWAMACQFPQRFAAVAPICGGGDPEQAARLKDVPVWAFHGTRDSVVPLWESQRMVQALKRAGGDVKFTTYPGCDHDCWTQTYANAQLYTWLLQHTRGGGAKPGVLNPTPLPSHSLPTHPLAMPSLPVTKSN